MISMALIFFTILFSSPISLGTFCHRAPPRRFMSQCCRAPKIGLYRRNPVLVGTCGQALTPPVSELYKNRYFAKGNHYTMRDSVTCTVFFGVTIRVSDHAALLLLPPERASPSAPSTQDHSDNNHRQHRERGRRCRTCLRTEFARTPLR